MRISQDIRIWFAIAPSLASIAFLGWIYQAADAYSTPPIEYHRLVHVDRPVFSKSELSKMVESQTVRVAVPDGFGSGVIFTRMDSGKRTVFIWTCYHVLYQNTEVITNRAGEKLLTFKNILGPAKIYFRGRTNETHIVQVGSPFMDVGLLKVTGDFPDCGSATFSDAPVEAGAELLTVNYSLSLPGPPSVFIGNFTTANRRLAIDDLEDQVQLPLYPGASGSGVYTMNGECVGLAEGRMSDGIGFTIPAWRIIRWARENHVGWALNPGIPLP